MIDDIESALKNSALFQGMNHKQIGQIVTRLNPKAIDLKNGEYLYRSGDPAVCCWVILSGRFLAQRSSPRHPFEPVDYHVGAVTGLLGLVEPGAHRPVSLIADGPVELIEIRGDDIAQLESSTRMIICENINHILIKKLFYCQELASLGE